MLLKKRLPLLIIKGTEKQALKHYVNLIEGLLKTNNIKYSSLGFPVKATSITTLKSPHVNKTAKVNQKIHFYTHKLSLKDYNLNFLDFLPQIPRHFGTESYKTLSIEFRYTIKDSKTFYVC